jgi:deoxyadenosine/deoxycytidine kinase
MPIFSIEGSIGAGKSTFLSELEKAGYKVLYEPVNDWSERIDGKDSMLELYYSDKKKYGFAFQMYVLQSRVSYLLEIIKNNPNEVIIMERCPMTDKKIFAEMMFDNGILNSYEFHVYNTWYQFLTSILPDVCGYIYLQVNPGVCIQRIINRNRSGESLIDVNYIQSLHERHDNWLLNSTDTPVCLVDGNGNIPGPEQVSSFIASLNK